MVEEADTGEFLPADSFNEMVVEREEDGLGGV